MNFELSDIHILIICCFKDVKKYEYGRILVTFLDDLRKLVSNKGERIMVDGMIHVLRAIVIAPCEQNNKPDANFTGQILTRGGTARVEKPCKCGPLSEHFRSFAVDKAEDEDQSMEVVSELNRVMGIVFAPRVPAPTLSYL
ncbi:hypothetical protein QAD02_005435 [Eretmocerus hayati]|uniref:Uncharacterized protein n=1 Tax=Eretmocerus hayati TaxID=131215 RepID=A0ACC2NTI1_9HYME|nr:hypothetical protein QAD02_005435 [Eretmocerus hayati]